MNEWMNKWMNEPFYDFGPKSSADEWKEEWKIELS